MKNAKEENSRTSLAYQGLSELPIKILRSKTLRELDLTHNKFPDFKFLLELPYLESLVLDHNELQSHAKFPHSQRLKTLWVNHNNISNLSVFISSISRSFPNLQYLSMMNNEAAPSFFNGSSFPQYMDYRHFVISQLPDLEILDHTPVTKTERKESHRIYGRFVPGARKASVALETTLASYKPEGMKKKRKRKKRDKLNQLNSDEVKEKPSEQVSSTTSNSSDITGKPDNTLTTENTPNTILNSKDGAVTSDSSWESDDANSLPQPQIQTDETVHSMQPLSLPVNPSIKKLGSKQVPETLPDFYKLDGLPESLPDVDELSSHKTASNTDKSLVNLPDLPEF